MDKDRIHLNQCFRMIFQEKVKSFIFKCSYIVKNCAWFFPVVLIIQTACSNGDSNIREQSQNDGDLAQENQRDAVKIPGPSCYLYATERDTVFLKLNPSVNGKVTGELNYLFFQRDSNVGHIEGEIRGDTLLADYTFLSEGLTSVREVAFLLGENQVMEGYGDAEEKDGRMVFRHSDSLDFSNGLVLPQVPCRQ
jgi:hypothetical protein